MEARREQGGAASVGAVVEAERANFGDTESALVDIPNRVSPLIYCRHSVNYRAIAPDGYFPCVTLS